jgi:nucleosome assembly protein 1-like 1
MADTNEAAIDDHEGHGDSPDEAATNEINKHLMKNPEVLAALQRQLHDMGPSPADYIRSLPKVVRRRLKALKKLQAETNKIESQFFVEVHALECKYAAQYEPLLHKRLQIVTAVAEPTDAECEWPSDEEEEDIAEEMKTKAKIEDNVEKPAAADETQKGVPDFWLTIFRNVDMLSEMVQEHDEPILKHLRDIKLNLNPSTGFTLEFAFGPNEYFTNTSLTKEYIYRFDVDKDDPLAYEGPEIIKCVGCTIDWQKGKNVTVKQVKKVQKHKGRGTKRTITKTVQADSFFNFFNPPQPPATEDEEPDEETEALLSADFEIGHFIREHIVPRAVLYFTGEALDDDEDEYDEGEGEEENEDDEDDDDDDEADVKHHHAPTKGKK